MTSVWNVRKIDHCVLSSVPVFPQKRHKMEWSLIRKTPLDGSTRNTRPACVYFQVTTTVNEVSNEMSKHKIFWRYYPLVQLLPISWAHNLSFPFPQSLSLLSHTQFQNPSPILIHSFIHSFFTVSIHHSFCLRVYARRHFILKTSVIYFAKCSPFLWQIPKSSHGHSEQKQVSGTTYIYLTVAITFPRLELNAWLSISGLGPKE